VEKLYQEITRHSSEELTSTHMEVFLNNFSIPLSTRSETTSPAGPVNMDAFLERVQHTMVSDQNPLQGLLQLVPMGFQYGGGGKLSGSDYTFPVNPAFCGADVLEDWNTRRRKPALMANDYQLLLRYLPFFQNEIYVRLKWFRGISRVWRKRRKRRPAGPSHSWKRSRLLGNIFIRLRVR